MRIAIGQVWQETNTFNPLATTFADFEALGIYRGAELLQRMAETNELGGFIQELRQWPERPEIVGLVRVGAWPAGLVTAEACAALLRCLLEPLEKQGPFDAVLLALHGSQAAQGEPDVEGRLLDEVRAIVGRAVPLVASLDLHANITPRMVAAADALVLYHTAPHIDVMATGRRAARVLRRILVEKARPTSALVKLPLVVPAERANTQDPASVSHGFRECLQAWETEPRVLCAGLATVQPWLDIPELGSAVLVTTDGDPALAATLASELGAEVWRRRREYLPTLLEVEDAVRAAHAQSEGLTVLGDGADATTSGSTGDGTALLQELVRYDWPRPALVPLVAPELVAEARRRGVGAEWDALLGGVRDRRFARPLALRVRVQQLFEARFILSGHLAEKLPIDMGPAAVLRHGNVHIVVTSRSGPHFAPQLFEAAGLDPFAASVLVAKSPCGFRAAYAPRARQIISVRGPGCAPPDFWRYPYQHIPRPLWPWDEIADWTPQARAFGPVDKRGEPGADTPSSPVTR
jgi:microcystin degradation protein MlrC